MRLKLLYGSDRPGPEADDYGFDGPTLYGVESVHSIYGIEMTIRFHDLRAMCQAERTTGWARHGDVGLILAIDTVGSFLKTREPSRSGMPAYYAQYLLIDEFCYSSEIKGDLEDIRYKLERIAINIR